MSFQALIYRSYFITDTVVPDQPAFVQDMADLDLHGHRIRQSAQYPMCVYNE